MKMFRGVLVFRAIAAAHVAAAQAEPQMDPSVSHFEAFLAAITAGLHFVDLIQVRALLGHRDRLLAIGAQQRLRHNDSTRFGLRLGHRRELCAQKFQEDSRTRPPVGLLLANAKKKHEQVKNLCVFEPWHAGMLGALLFEIIEKFREGGIHRERRAACRRFFVVETTSERAIGFRESLKTRQRVGIGGA
jgi:hypothetical protein